MSRVCFVTVGTTRFDDLVFEVCSPKLRKVLRDKGFTELLIQAGSSDIPPVESGSDLLISVYKYKPSIEQDIAQAELIISHAGAGSCLEVMHAGKPCIVVINDKLMGNHQVELAQHLASLRHLVYTTPRNLAETLINFRSEDLEPYERGQPELFASFLKKVLGMSD